MHNSAPAAANYRRLDISKRSCAVGACGALIVAFVCGTLVPELATADTVMVSAESDHWQFAGSLYLWGAAVGGTANFPVMGTSADFSIDAKTLLNSLNMGGMGAFDAHKGRWGVLTDVIYLNVGAGKSGTADFKVSNIGPPATVTADLHLNVKAWIMTLAGEYRVSEDPAWNVDLLAGGRYMDVSEALNWSLSAIYGPIPIPDQVGSAEVSSHVLDGIVGVKGSYAFGAGRNWSIPFYLDGGAGDSDHTIQAALGVGYSFQWGQVSAMWRYVDYKLKSGPIENVNFSGPLIGATFRW